MENDDKYYQQVANELKAVGPNEALWLKAFASANADKEKAKALYIKLRVEQLIAVDVQKRKNELIAAELEKHKPKTNYTIKCPQCHSVELIAVASVRNPSSYKSFKITYNSFLGRIKFNCNKCGKIFTIYTQLLE